MEHIYNLRVHLISDGEYTRCETHGSGELSNVGKVILLSKVMKAIGLNPDSVSDLSIVSVALEHCQDS